MIAGTDALNFVMFLCVPGYYEVVSNHQLSASANQGKPYEYPSLQSEHSYSIFF
jgi:hypothetical protein